MKIAMPGHRLDGADVQLVEVVAATEHKPGGLLVQLIAAVPPFYCASTEVRDEAGNVIAPSVLPQILIRPDQVVE